MKPWLRLVLVLITVGGGFSGFCLCVQQVGEMLRSEPSAGFNLLLMIVFMGLFVFVTISGLLFVKDEKRTGPMLVAFAIQIPWVSSSMIVYKFATAVYLAFAVGQGETGIRLNADMYLGSTFQFSMFQVHPWQIGVNIVPLALVIILSTVALPQRIKIQTEVV